MPLNILWLAITYVCFKSCPLCNHTQSQITRMPSTPTWYDFSKIFSRSLGGDLVICDRGRFCRNPFRPFSRGALGAAMQRADVWVKSGSRVLFNIHCVEGWINLKWTIVLCRGQKSEWRHASPGVIFSLVAIQAIGDELLFVNTGDREIRGQGCMNSMNELWVKCHLGGGCGGCCRLSFLLSNESWDKMRKSGSILAKYKQMPKTWISRHFLCFQIVSFLRLSWLT